VTAIRTDAELVAYCGLYCGACRSYLAGRCKGCHEHTRAAWCRVRSCCIERRVTTCAACAEFDDPRQCRRFDNIVSKLFGLLFRSDRAACIAQIKRLGVDGHAAAMAESGSQTIRR
jgi:Protein of unknown function (DUF3795)